MTRTVGLLLAAVVATEASAGPNTVVHSGRLTGASGGVVEGTRVVRFDLYAGGPSIWSESHTVTFESGYFAAVLGSSTPLPVEALQGNVEVGVTVDGVELTRQALHAAPSALSVQGAVRLTGAPATCGSPTTGALRMNGANLEFCDGTAWRRLAAEPSVTSTKATQWDQAYSWGNHATAGYVTATCPVNTIARRAGTGSGWVCDPVPPGSNLVTETTGWQDAMDTVSVPLPSGVTGLAHRSDESGTSCYNWATSYNVPVDANKAYEFSIWIKASQTDLDNYMGFFAYDASGAIINGPASEWGNPYFKTGQGDPNSWVRWSGYLLPSNTTRSGGLAATQASATNGADWVLPAGTTAAHIRFGTCYGDGVGGGQTWYAHPEIREIDVADLPGRSDLRVYRDSEMATMTNTTSATAIPGLGVEFYAVAGTPLTLELYTHQRCADSYFYQNLFLNGQSVSVSGAKGHTSWRVNNHIMWNGVAPSTGMHTVTATWEGGTSCSSNSGEHGTGGKNVSLTAWVGG
jgi:hypothetical protein